ncbi:MAG TPA: hypothetical protein VEU08_11375 [Vicinamibacterales bacterium]|nr:hypothetical protein [Vicinamibacterales bacterium]
MPRTIRAIAAGAAVVVLSAGAAFAQRPPVKSVLDNYDKGKKAVEQKKYQEAIEPLTAAIAQDPTDRTYREGAFAGSYFPHHYLFIAYVETGDLAKARQAAALRGPAAQDLAAQAAPYMARLNTPASGGGGGTPAGGGGAPAGGNTPAAGGGAPAVSERALTAYRAGVDAMKANRWADAATQFTNAIRIDGTPRATDSPDGYFPQYYLAIADLRQGRLDDATANFDKRGTIAKTAYLADEEAKFPKELDFARFSAAGDDAFGKQQLTAAVDGWQKACAASPEDCNSRGYRQKITETQAVIARNAAVTEARQHIVRAQTYIAQGDLDAAKQEYTAAGARDPNNADAAAGLKDIQTREEAYTSAKSTGEAAQRANRLDDAMKAFETARQSNQQRFLRDKLDTVESNINTQLLKTQGIAQVAANAQKAFDAGNFASARQGAETVLAQEPNNAAMKALVPRADSRILLEEGRKMYAAGDFFQADAKYRAASDKDPSNDAAQKAFAQSSQYLGFVQQKAYAQAERADAVRFGKERPDQNFEVLNLIKQANDSFANADYGSAGRSVDEVLKRDPENKNAIGLKNRIDAARNAGRAALAQNPVQVATEAAPLVPMWMWGAIAGVTFLGAGSLFVVRGRTPTPVAIDSLPWGRVAIQQRGKPAKAAPSEKTTPFLINLPPGEYELQVTSESMSQPYSTTITVVRGASNKVVVTNPAYDVDEIVSSLLG